MSWTRDSLTSTSVNFTLSEAFRLGYFTSCIGHQPTVNEVIPASVNGRCVIGTLDYGDGSAPEPFGINVTSVDAANDILQGYFTLTHTYPNNNTFTARWTSCCRLSPSSALQNNTDGNWNVQTVVNLSATSGGLKSPTSLLPAATPCSVGAVCVIPIPVTDDDPGKASITYRLSTPLEMGAANETQPPGATVDASTGVYTWNSFGHGAAGDLWNGSVMIEARNAAGVIIATAQVDFLIQQITGVPPVFDFPPTPTSGSVLPASVGSPLSFVIEAKSTANFPVHLNTNSTISGSTLTCPTAATQIDCTFAWTPTIDDVGPHLVSFVAQDSTGKNSSTLQITINVKPVEVYVTPDNQSKTYGDTDPAFTFGTSGFLGTDDFTTAPTCGVSGAHSDAGTYSITCSGGMTRPGYHVNYGTADLTVSPKTLTITPDNLSVAYGDPQHFTFQTDGLVGTDALTQAPTCDVSGQHTDVGTYPIVCSGATASGNYVITYGTGTLTVGARTITITANDVTATYGDTPDFTFTADGLVGTDSLSQNPTCAVSGPHANAGTYQDQIVCSGTTASGNYTITYKPGTLTVTPKTITVTPDNQVKTYGDNDPAFTFSVSPLVPGDTLAQQPTCGVSAPHSDANTYTIECSGGAASSNYVFDYRTAKLTVNPRTVTVAADSHTITYGDPDPAFGFQNTPFVGADTFTDAPTCGVAGAHASAGSYPITCSGATASANYTIGYAPGSLVVKQATVTITPNDQMKLPTDPDPTFTYQISGLVGNDTLTTNPTCGVAGAHDTPGTYAITCSGADAGSNYVVAYGPTATLTVAKATPNLSTSPSATVPVGGLISDSATLNGGASPTGTVTFRLYAPGDNHCSTAIATLNQALSGKTATSGTVQATQAGVYNWVATYGGDSKNNSVTGDCGSERVIVTAQVLTGRAYAVSLSSSLAGLPLLTVKPSPDTGPVSTTASGTTAPPCVANINGLAGVQAACSSVVTVGGFGARSTATASVAAATISVATLPAIVVQGVQSTSTTSCAGSSGSVTVGYLKVGTVVVISKPTAVAPNTVINVGVVKLVLNEQVPFTTPDAGLRVNSIHATVNAAGLAILDTVISSSESDIGNCP